MAAVRKGVGREVAHEVIREHAVAVALARREGTELNLFDRLAADPRLGLNRDELGAIESDPSAFTGAAGSQIAAVAARIAKVCSEHGVAAAYVPAAIL